VCISWTIKCLILLMHGPTMKLIPVVFRISFFVSQKTHILHHKTSRLILFNSRLSRSHTKLVNSYTVWEKCIFFFILRLKQYSCRPGQVLGIPGGWGSQISRHRHMKVVRLTALHTGRLYLPGNIPGTHFC